MSRQKGVCGRGLGEDQCPVTRSRHAVTRLSAVGLSVSLTVDTKKKKRKKKETIEDKSLNFSVLTLYFPIIHTYTYVLTFPPLKYSFYFVFVLSVPQNKGDLGFKLILSCSE